MKKPDSPENAAATKKPSWSQPALRRLGTLRELTQNMNGGAMDGGFAGMTMP